MDKLIEILSLEQFENACKEKSVFLFTADWCPDCVFIKPFIGEIVEANKDYTFYMINRDNFIDLCKDLDVLGIPSFVAFDNGEVIGRFVSKLRKSREEIQAFIDTLG
ncbi:thioredoxin family protein [Tannockella kyphosi]|uniref:thioredoxin family protein n=1 Tax=Tannockella kyphosi TaxID=2899121 RepID=UPI00201326D3|nr:thioredoxin family protein [Tannockella kyphosi]